MRIYGQRGFTFFGAGRSMPASRIFAYGAAALVVAFGVAVWYVGAQEQTTPEVDGFLLDGMRACHEGPDRQSCLASLASKLADGYATADVLAALGRYETREQIFVEDCHALAHNLGRELYERAGSVGAVIAEGSPVCLAGVFHGALEGYFMARHDASDLNDGETRSMVASVCEPREAFKSEWEYGNCYHGLGHALMFFTDNDLPRALDLCSVVASEDRRVLCYDGALMENESSAEGVHPSEYYRADDPYYPCPVLDTPYQGECYTYGIAHRFQGDTEMSANVCRGVPVEHRTGCFYSTGLHAVMNTVDPPVIAGKCGTIPEPEFKGACIEGAAVSLALRVAPESGTTIALCSLLDAGTAGACYKTAIAAIRGLADASVRKKLCEDIPDPAYRAQCLSGE